MKLHLMMCNTSHQYVKQIKFFQKAISGIDKHRENIVLSDEAKNRIQEKLDPLNGEHIPY
jgi:hypothetical protein